MYFLDDDARGGRRIYNNDARSFWLRSPGGSSGCAALVFSGGDVDVCVLPCGFKSQIYDFQILGKLARQVVRFTLYN